MLELPVTERASEPRGRSRASYIKMDVFLASVPKAALSRWILSHLGTGWIMSVPNWLYVMCVIITARYKHESIRGGFVLWQLSYLTLCNNDIWFNLWSLNRFIFLSTLNVFIS